MESGATDPPLQRHLQLETDYFCHRCGYNLHGQVVTRDERLDILICRCPECGQFHPAAMGVSATRPWLARLGVILASLIVLGVVLVFGLGGLFLGICMYSHLDEYTMYATTASSPTQELRLIRPDPVPGTPEYFYNTDHQLYWKMDVFFTVLLGTILGMFSTVVMWHVARRRLRWIILFPTVVGLIVFVIWNASYNIGPVFGWSVLRLIEYVALGGACIAIGQVIGRPVARYVVTWTVPPRLRQHLQFLWLVDGKPAPTL